MPEYYSQNWQSGVGYPFKYQINETPIFVDNTLVQLKQTPLHKDKTRVQLYILKSQEREDSINQLINGAGNLIDENPASQVVSDKWYRLTIDNIDIRSGLIRIKNLLAPDGSVAEEDTIIYRSDVLLAFYTYEELEYTFNKISINPIFNHLLYLWLPRPFDL